MDIETKKEGNILCIKPLGNSINASTCAGLKNKFLDQISQGHKAILLNLSHIDFIDSTGLGVIISLLKTVAQNKGFLAICEVKAPINDLFALTRLNNIFQMCPNENEGVQSLTKLMALPKK